MYGMVNDAVRGLVKENFGDDAWERIHTAAEVPESFVPMEAYDDGVTYRLVAAAVEILEMKAEDVLHAFGMYWVGSVATVHYADVMANTGIGFVDFVKNLDHMHQRLRVTFPNYRPPSFRVVDLADDQIQVDYYSERVGLLPFVEGLLQGLSKHFDQPIAIEHVPDASHPLPCKRMIVSLSAE